MNSEFGKGFFFSVLLHVVVFAGVFCFVAFAPTPRIDPPMMMVDMGGGGGGGEEAAPPPPPPASKAETPPQPKEEKQPEKIEPAKIEPPKQPEMVISKKETPKKKPIEKPKEVKKEEVKKPEPPKKEQPPKTETPKKDTKPTVKNLGPTMTRSEFEKHNPSQRMATGPDPKKLADDFKKRTLAALNSVKDVGLGGGTGAATNSGGGSGSEFGEYKAMLYNILRNSWEVPGQATLAMTTVVRIHISRDGSLSFVKIVKSSGSSVMDESVVAAIDKNHKVDPLPEGMGSSREFEIGFNPER